MNICLMDLPDELIRKVAIHLVGERNDGDWYRSFEGYDFDNFEDCRPRRPHDALALSACCKSTRCIIFQDLIMREVSVGLNRKELSDFAALPKEVRCCVR